MIEPLLHLVAAVPLLTVAVVAVAVWLVRRRPGRLRPVWLLGFGALLLGADDPPLPSPAGGASVATPPTHTVEGGFGGGQYPTCGGVRSYGDMGAIYRYSTPVSRQTNVVLGAGVFGGVDAGAPNGAMHGEVGLDHRWAAGSVGFAFGVLHRDSTLSSPLLPTATLRLGPRDIVFVDASVFSETPAPLPGPGLTLGAGVAFPRLGNTWEPFRLRAGLSLSGFYLSPTVPLGDAGNLDLVGTYGDPDTWGVATRVRIHWPGRLPQSM